MVWSCSLKPLSLAQCFWPWISTGRPSGASDLNTGLNAACGAPVGLLKSSSRRPPSSSSMNTNWFHLPLRWAWIKVCVAWLHRACTIYAQIPKSVSVICVRCKSSTTALHHSNVLLGGLKSDWYQTHRCQPLISNHVFKLKLNKICCSVWSPSTSQSQGDFKFSLSALSSQQRKQNKQFKISSPE